ncbi:MAG TPA: DnaJ domain-containing protein [Ktedonobacteraceae bacterium]
MIFNYYKLLGVAASASAAEIKKAYRRLAREHHPDVNASARDEQIKRLNEAYEILSNARKRAAYDELLREARERAEEILAERERQRQQASPPPAEEDEQKEPEMTWMQGIFGFVRELKKGMREE